MWGRVRVGWRKVSTDGRWVLLKVRLSLCRVRIGLSLKTWVRGKNEGTNSRRMRVGQVRLAIVVTRVVLVV